MSDDGKITITLDPTTAQQLAERAREGGVSPEQYAADIVAEMVAGDDFSPLTISDDELRMSIESQRHDIAAGSAALYTHDEVVAGARAILAKAHDAKR